MWLNRTWWGELSQVRGMLLPGPTTRTRILYNYLCVSIKYDAGNKIWCLPDGQLIILDVPTCSLCQHMRQILQNFGHCCLYFRSLFIILSMLKQITWTVQEGVNLALRPRPPDLHHFHNQVIRSGLKALSSPVVYEFYEFSGASGVETM